MGGVVKHNVTDFHHVRTLPEKKMCPARKKTIRFTEERRGKKKKKENKTCRGLFVCLFVYSTRLFRYGKQHNLYEEIHDLSTQQQGTGPILANFESLLL